MDGANKFVRGDAIAGLLITFINFIAGIVIGVIINGMSFNEAIKTYTTDDGLEVSHVENNKNELFDLNIIGRDEKTVGMRDKTLNINLKNYYERIAHL